ncbi:hypothetical protein Tdes44962_MAKER06138 [Teratosphaeria destructans]|uniref:PUM-HD domain-containing protein n=1 Tax=Teratosphaeria destructans TaxID=418781 RepID=A0A9W7SI23_9PEZI|nr:hypothetical protein Tdes44962_MAKER06138 [Teratosphaeria destructans]
MGGIKRKEAPGGAANGYKKQKTVEHRSSHGKKKSRLDEAAEDDDFGGFDDEESAEKSGKSAPSKHGNGGSKEFKLEGTTSAEAHAKQRALAKERKAAKPNADIIARSKKIWEKLRRKSHVPKEERKELVDELFSIITGRVREFVFKHDSVRVIQCALKYANQEQRRMIVDELRDDIRPLVESKYGKFLVAKMVVEGDQAIRNVVVPQFYGHVKRLINHPEASWIVDDIYRQIATSQQKAIMLREWYGTEFALENRDKKVGEVKAITANLKQILEEAPEKRKPVMQAANQLINSLIQKKMTGFTMLHDAMLQYFLALQPSTEEHSAFLELLKGDIETKVEAEAANSTGGGDLFRNLAFTKSGSRLVCLAIAYGSAKDRKVIMKCFKDTVDMMCFDQYAKMVLVTGLDVPDDTKMSGKAIFHELLGQNIEDETQRLDRSEQIAANLNARVPMLYPLAGPAKWLINDAADKALLEEIYEIRKTTSKKAPDSRRKELLQYLSSPILDFVTKRASNLAQSSFGCQCITETLLEANSDATAEQKTSAKEAVAQLAAGDPSSSDHVAQIPAVGRMLKTLVLGGNFDPETKSTKLVEPRLGFAEQLFPVIEEYLVPWACGPSPFVVVALLESEDVSENVRQKVKAGLRKGKKEIEKATKGDGERKGSAGAKLVLEKL